MSIEIGKTRECDQLFPTPYFTMKHIEIALTAAKRGGIKPEDLKFTFGQRHDLSGVPFDLYSEGEITFEPETLEELKARFEPKGGP